MYMWVLQEPEMWWDEDEWGLPPEVSVHVSADSF